MAWASKPIFWELVMRSSPRNRSRGLSTCARYSRTTYRCTSCRVSWEARELGVRVRANSPHPGHNTTPQAPSPLRYLCAQWGHVLQMVGESHHLVHEGLQHVMCQPGLGTQDPEKRLGAEGDRSLPGISSPSDPLLGAQNVAPNRGFQAKGQRVTRKKFWRACLTPF
uniref:Uncharacterized protein n=1 Tax=Canis lupus familiaris TaxID=9615 RepID=A0A8P0TLY5_CANLF